MFVACAWLFVLFCVVVLVIKIVKMIFFGIKHRDNLFGRKQGGTSVNTFVLSGAMPSLCLVIFLE